MEILVGYWPDAGWVIYPRSARKETGTVEWKDVIEWGFGTSDEARAAASLLADPAIDREE